MMNVGIQSRTRIIKYFIDFSYIKVDYIILKLTIKIPNFTI